MRRYTHLTQEQRYQIAALLKEKIPQAKIALSLGVNKSTISREIRRNHGGHGYFPAQAQRLALDRRRDKSLPRIDAHTWAIVEDRLRCQQWSPEQISGWMKITFGQTLSHERIYQHVLEDKANGGDLFKRLRCRKKRRSRYGAYRKRQSIAGRTGIEQRPAIVETRQRVGDWESDTVVGPSRPVLVTLVERRSRLTRIVKVDCSKADEVGRAICSVLAPLKDRVLTITTDNGTEFARHGDVAGALEAQFYFAHPYSSWERGLNENTNGLIRQYFPKGTDFSKVSDRQIQMVEEKLNSRPRKSLGYKTPSEVFSPP
jgi:IS30 family transposase